MKFYDSVRPPATRLFPGTLQEPTFAATFPKMVDIREGVGATYSFDSWSLAFPLVGTISCDNMIHGFTSLIGLMEAQGISADGELQPLQSSIDGQE